MFYLIERAADLHREELRREALRERQVRVFAGQRFRFRRPVGHFLVRVGNRLSGERRSQPRLAAAGESG